MYHLLFLARIHVCAIQEYDMTKVKADGIIEAVRYGENGEILWARGYLRRGPTWSDRLLFDRQALLDLLNTGKKIYTGQRCVLLGATFETAAPLQIKEQN
jgi:hypothetical protein